MLGFTMLGGRFSWLVPVLALAGNLASKKSVPPSGPGTPCEHRAFHRAAGQRDLILSALPSSRH